MFALTNWLCVILAAREAFEKAPKMPLYFSDGSEENMSGMLWEGEFQGALWFFYSQ